MFFFCIICISHYKMSIYLDFNIKIIICLKEKSTVTLFLLLLHCGYIMSHSFLTPLDCTPPGSVRGISQERILERVAISSCRGYSWPRHQTQISCIGKQIIYHWANLGNPMERLLRVKHYLTSCFHLFITNLLNTYLAHPFT